MSTHLLHTLRDWFAGDKEGCFELNSLQVIRFLKEMGYVGDPRWNVTARRSVEGQ